MFFGLLHINPRSSSAKPRMLHRVPANSFFLVLSLITASIQPCATAEAAGVKFELTTLAKMGRFDQEVSIDMPAASDIPRLETITVRDSV